MEGSRDELRRRMLAAPIIKKQAYVVTAEEPAHASATNASASSAPSTGGIQTKVPQLYSADNRSVSRMLFDIITLLKTEEKPLTNNDIIRKLAINIASNDELFHSVCNNERIFYDEARATFEYKPVYNIRSKDDLLALLKRHQGNAGMDVKELKDSCNSILTLIEDLDAEKSIITVRKDGVPKLVYFNNRELNLEMSEDFKLEWGKIELPLEADLSKELHKAGLKSMEVIDINKGVQVKAKVKAKRKPRFNVTNKHLKGIDMSKDVTPIIK